MLARTVKLVMLFATIYFVGIGCSLHSGSAANESNKNNILPYHISKLIMSNENTTINQKGIVVFSLNKSVQEKRDYIAYFEKEYGKKYNKKVVVIFPNEKELSAQSDALYKWVRTTYTNQLFLKERLDHLRVCTTSCADGIGIFRIDNFSIEEGYNRFLNPNELIQRLSH